MLEVRITRRGALVLTTDIKETLTLTEIADALCDNKRLNVASVQCTFDGGLDFTSGYTHRSYHLTKSLYEELMNVYVCELMPVEGAVPEIPEYHQVRDFRYQGVNGILFTLSKPLANNERELYESLGYIRLKSRPEYAPELVRDCLFVPNNCFVNF